MMFLNIIIKQYFIRHFGQSCLPFTVQIIPHLWFNLKFLTKQFNHSVVSNSLWPHWTAAHQASLFITKSWSLPKLLSIDSRLPSNHLILCRPLLLLPSIFPSIRVFSDESVLCIRWPKYWSFSFSISPSNGHSGLISLGWTGRISLQSKGLSKVFSTPQFKSINSLVLSFLYSPTLTSIPDHWKKHSFD